MKDAIPTYVRIPNDLKERIDAAASSNRRSRNAEIVTRLEDSFHPSRQQLVNYPVGDLLGELLRRYAPDEIMIRIGKEPS